MARLHPDTKAHIERIVKKESNNKFLNSYSFKVASTDLTAALIKITSNAKLLQESKVICDLNKSEECSSKQILELANLLNIKFPLRQVADAMDNIPTVFTTLVNKALNPEVDGLGDIGAFKEAYGIIGQNSDFTDNEAL